MGYWAVHEVLLLDQAFKRDKMAELGKELASDQNIGVLTGERREEIESEYNQHRRDIEEIDSVLTRARHAYEYAVLESKWAGHMTENGITEEKERREFL